MHAVEIVFAVVWAAFWGYWLIAAFSMKRGNVPWSREIGIRVLLIAIFFLLFHLGLFHLHGENKNLWLAALGLVLLALGLGVAVWARVNLGRNWGTPMTQKAEPELVTSGPYRFVRHPIYSGILLAGIGTAIAVSWLWIVPVGFAGMYFIYSATVEEQFMSQTFPDAYPAYKHTTKMLVPFVF